MRVSSTLFAAALAGLVPAAALAQEAPGAPPAKDAETEQLRDLVKRLESRVAELEREREFPLADVRTQSGSALESAIRSVNLSGYMEYIYSYNARSGGPVAGSRGDTLGYNQLRGPDADANGFSFQNLELLADRPLTTICSTGFHIRTAYGMVAKAEKLDPNFDTASNAFDVGEAWFSWRAPFEPLGHVDLSMGKFRAPVGFEVLENTDNWQITRNPIAAFGTPATVTGAEASLPLADKLAANLYLVNGWDSVRGPTDGKTGIANIVIGRFDDPLSSQVQVNASYGSIATVGTPQGDKLRFFEMIWDGKFSSSTEFALDAIWGDSAHHEWHGTAAYVRHHATEKVWISCRGGWYADDALGASVARIIDGTVAVGCEVAQGLTVALEFRHDFSRSAGTYLSAGGGPSEQQDTLTASFLYRF